MTVVRLTDRRTVLRLGGGVVALAVGIGAGVLDRRSDDGPEAAPEPSGPTASSSSTTTTITTTSAPPTTTSTVPPVAPDEVPPGVIAIGIAYLSLRPDEADLETLLGLLPSPDGDVVASARTRVADDFTAARTVDVDGWVLAESEGRAAAVLSLVCSPSC